MIVNEENKMEQNTGSTPVVDNTNQPTTDTVEQAPVATDPNPPDKEKIYSYFVSLYDKSGKTYDEQRLRKLSNAQDPRYWVDKLRKDNGLPALTEEQYTGVYNSWFNPADTEKKNLGETLQGRFQQNAVVVQGGELDSQSIIDTTNTSLESQEYDLDKALARNSSYYVDQLDNQVTMLPALRTLPSDFLSLGEEEAAIVFNNTLGKFRYKAEQTGMGNALKITRPDGSQFDIQLMSGLAYTFEKGSTDYNQRLGIKHNQFILNAAQGKSNIVVTMSEDFISNPNGINQAINGYTKALNIPDQEDIKFLSKATTGDENMVSYVYGGEFDEGLFMANLKAVKNRLQPIYQKQESEYRNAVTAATLQSVKTDNLVIPERFEGLSKEEQEKQIQLRDTYLKLEDIFKRHEAQKRRTSRLVGAALKYSNFNIDLNDQEAVDALISQGVNPMDIPLPSLKLNGEQASFQDIYDVISKPVELRYVRTGEINVEIDPNVDSGAFNELVKRLAETQERNTAFIEESPKTNQFFRGVGDMFQGLYVHTMDLMNDFGHAISDGLQMIGVPKETADDIVFEKYVVTVGAGNNGAGGFGIGLWGFPTTERIDEMKKWLPEYDMTISDSRDAGEFLAMGMEGFTQSAPYTLAFLANPALGFATTAVGTYGSSREEMNIAIQAAKDAQASGVILTERERELLKMSNTEARLNALTKAGVETAITAAFTGRYFRQLQLSKNLKGVPKTKASSQQLADAFARKHRTGLIASFAKYTGLDPAVVSKEVPEEMLVATFTYMTDVAWGLEEYDQKKMNKLWADSGLNSIFSSVPMSAAGRIMGPNIDKTANDYIRRNINLPGENKVVTQKLEADKIVQDLEKEGLSKTSTEFKVALDAQSKLDNQVNDIEKRKQQLVESMSVADKQAFLQGLANIQKLQSVITNGNKAETIDSSIKLMDEERARLSNLLTKYPSELSYYFLPTSEQTRLKERAMKEIEAEKKAEAEQKGGDYTINLTDMDAEVINRAAKIYVDDVNKARTRPTEEVSVKGYFIENPSEYYTETTDQEAADFDIEAAISKVESDLFNQPTEAPTEAPVEAPTELQAEGVMPEGEQEVQEPTQEPVIDEAVQRRNSIINRIKNLNKSKNFYNGLGVLEQKIIKDFFNDIEKGKNPRFARVENIIRSQEISYELLALNQGGITIFDKSDRLKKINKWSDPLNPLWYIKNNISPFSMLHDVYPYLNNEGRKMMTAFGKGRKIFVSNQMTADVLLGAVFKNSKEGKPMIDLVDSGNRNVALSMIEAQNYIDEDLAQWKADVEEYNKTVPKDKRIPTNLLEINFNKVGIPTGLTDTQLSVDYEMQVLAHLRRLSGETDQLSGMDTEFLRQKNSLLKELQLRKEEAEKDPKDVTAKTKYEQLKTTLENLGVADAKSFADVSSNARKPILNALERLSARFPHQQAKQRKMDYDGQESFFMEGSYVPSFRIGVDGADIIDGRNSNPNKYGTMAGLLQDVTQDDQLENSRISFGNYMGRAYSQLRGALIDINARGDFETLNSMVNSQNFRNLFTNEQEYEMVKKYFGSRLDVFNGLITEGQNANVDFGDLPTTLLSTDSKFMQSSYSLISAFGLARLNQPASQFYSALSGTYPMLTDKRAKNHVNWAGARFMFGLAESGNGQKVKGGRFKQYISNLIGGGNLQNIYNQSRTGLRNALKAEFAIDNKKTLPLSYYVSRFNLSEDFGKNTLNAGKYTLDGFLDAINKSNELSLEFFLASADRAAANASFEAHYLQHRIDQGAIIPQDIDSWWAKENENPNIEAIQYADRRVAETMRQTEPTSEAEFYAKDASSMTKASQRTLFAWGKFQMNAKANFANQMARLADPSLPEVEKEEARRRLRGIMSEVMTFQGIKNAADYAAMTGLSAAYFMLMGGDEEDVRRYGGMTQLINDFLLPVESPEYKELLETLPRSEAKTLEQFKLSMQESASGFEADVLELYKYAYEFEQKNTLGTMPNVIIKAGADAMKTAQPFPIANPLVDIGGVVVNELFGEEVIPDYISKDLEKAMQDSDGIILALKENSGMLGIAAESWDKLLVARRLYNDRIFSKGIRQTGSGEIIEYVRADNDVMQQKLDSAIKLLYWGRWINIATPGPKGDLTKILNKIERTIEEKFTQGAPTVKGINSAFVQFYLEKLSEKGETVDPHNFDKWWESEKKNMNKEARDYAIDKVEEIRRAKVYGQE